MNQREAYRNFFIKSEEGQEFTKTLFELVNTAHENAEKSTDRDESFAFTQQARGVRQVIEHIQSATATTKKGRSTT